MKKKCERRGAECAEEDAEKKLNFRGRSILLMIAWVQKDMSTMLMPLKDQTHFQNSIGGFAGAPAFAVVVLI